MKKSVQLANNEKVIQAYNELPVSIPRTKQKKLRSCQAYVLDYGKWWILESYNTIVACIDTETDTLYDFLRYVYGYTSTSAQHISKFEKDYGRGKWGCTESYRYYPI